jgi:RimJ/RimL family protein N-acetyltransferase
MGLLKHIISNGTPNMNLPIDQNFYISDIGPQDVQDYIEYFKERQIYEQTLNIPFPYTMEHAQKWISIIQDLNQKNDGVTVNWAIRRSSDDRLVGGIGFHGLIIGTTEQSELGYWLAKPYWGKGIMSIAAKKSVDFAFDNFNLKTIVANVFDFNKASARVLEKAGFQYQRFLKDHYTKDGRTFSGLSYAITNPKSIHHTKIQEKK